MVDWRGAEGPGSGVGGSAYSSMFWQRKGCGPARAGKPPALTNRETRFLEENAKQLCEPTQCLFGS